MRALHFAPFVVSIAGASLFTGCGSDSEPLPAGGGGDQVVTGGASAAAGASGKGGASASGGSAGKSGSGASSGAPTGGTGGTSTAGTGGGSSGEGGASGGGAGGGTAGKAGSSAAGMAGNAGASGSAGAGGSAGASGSGGSSAGNGGAGGASGAAGAGGAMCTSNVPVVTIPALSGTPEDKTAVLMHLANGMPCNDPIDASFYADATPPSPWDASHRGDIVRCGYDRLVTKAEVKQHFATLGLPDPGAEVGAHKIRVLYWTERNVGQPILTSGAMYIPEVRVAAPAPLLSIGHGTVGIADICAPSREDPKGFNEDWQTMVYGLVTHGWTSIVPDFPGIGTSGTGTWMYSPDEGHALLDGTRAARKLTAPGFLSTHNVLVGHSNGGHAALSAQAYASSYGASGTIDAAVLYAPYWLNNGAWGALFGPLGKAFFSDGTFAFGMMYDYGHLGAYDGPGHETDAWDSSKNGFAAAKNLMENACLQDMVNLKALIFPNQTGSDLFTSDFTGPVATCGLFNKTCPSGVAATWKDRWIVDRPVVDSTIPIVLWQGGADTTISPARAQCGVDRMAAENAMLTTCWDVCATHQTILPSGTPWIRQYLAQMTLGGSAPPACNSFPALTCSSPPPNPTDPNSP